MSVEPTPLKRLRRVATASRRRRPDDRGAVGVTFGILLASGVLLGAMAIVVDVGRLYVERGELRNGADAAALALARACAENAPECASESELRTLATHYAGVNATDGVSRVARVCGDVPGVLEPCDEQPANLAGCLGPPPLERYVEVHVRTQMQDGSTVLPPVFAQTLAGGDAGSTVGACARAAWGDLSVLAVTVHECVYQWAPHLPADEPISAAGERAIQFWFWDAPPCSSGDIVEPRSPDVAGLLDGGDGSCEISMSPDGVIGGHFIRNEPYGRATDACRDRIRDAWASGEIIYLPVHDTRSMGESPSFHHVFVAPFIVTGYQLGIPPPPYNPPIEPPPYDPEDYLGRSYLFGSNFDVDPCGTDDLGFRCLTGVFVGEPIDVSQLTGHSRIRLVG